MSSIKLSGVRSEYIEPSLVPPLDPPTPLPTDADVDRWHSKLRASPRELAYLHGRGITDDVIDEFEVGFDGQRIWYPIRDKHGVLVNVRKYNRHPSPGFRKIYSTKGMGSPSRLYPLAVLGKQSEFVIVTEGEADALSAIALGFVSVIGTNGASGVPKGPELEPLRGRDVVLAFDGDGAGRKAGNSWSTRLAGVASSIRSIDLGDGTDLNDICKTPGGAAKLSQLIAGAGATGAPATGNRRAVSELLRVALRRVQDDGEGRNETGFWLACQLRDERYAKTEASEVLHTYQEAVEGDRDAPYTRAESDSSLEQAYSGEARQPSGAGVGVKEERFSDSPLSRYVADRLRGEYAFVSELGSGGDWLRNTGKVWRPTTRSHLTLVVQDELDRLFEVERAAGASPGQIMKLLSKTKIASVRDLLTGLLEESISLWDNYPDHLNCQNGVLHLPTGKLEPHGNFRWTMIAPINYVKGARLSMWDHVLEAIPEDIRRHMQLVFGQAITGYPPTDDKGNFLEGGGENGKSTLLDAITTSLGYSQDEGSPAYAGDLPEKVLFAPTGAPPVEKMRLRGKRLVMHEELPEGEIPMKRLKDLLGTQRMSGRAHYKQGESWEASHTLFITTNHRPLVTDTTHAVWRRLRLVVFPYKFVRHPNRRTNERRARDGLREHFRTVPEPAVLAWLVEGARAWYDNGKKMPEEPDRLRESWEAWRMESDDMLRFLSDHFTFKPGAIVLEGHVWAALTEWADNNSRRKWSRKDYAAALTSHDTARAHHVLKARKRLTPEVAAKVTYPARKVGPHIRHPQEKTPTNPNVFVGLAWREAPTDEE
ncbi:phage/plasmid primase, P4 family [Agreia sp. Leaf244]|uniref:phage/plasmid primase, P4 family n=1 Tax=Agreia sp. Leaf244 TaxID=1736305 RepID=UPI0009EB092E|nr:phage/plasmid primase, P4 family [Agreia sp. Leaf244]